MEVAELKNRNTAPAEKSPAQVRADGVRALIQKHAADIRRAMPAHLSAERLLKVTTTAVTSNPKLLDCYAPTLLGAVMQCGQMGLEPNTVLGHAYLLPFRNNKKDRDEVQVIVGYKGLIDLARRSGHVVSIAAHAVHQHDTFEYEYGLDEKLRHIPASGDRGEVTHFYAVAKLKDGGHAFEVMTVEDVKRIRARSQGKNNKVWDEHFVEMGRKTALRRLSKFLPLSVEFATAAALDEAAARGAEQNLEGALAGEFNVLPTEDDPDAQGDDPPPPPANDAPPAIEHQAAPAAPRVRPQPAQSVAEPSANADLD